MNCLLPIYIWPIPRLLRGAGVAEEDPCARRGAGIAASRYAQPATGYDYAYYKTLGEQVPALKQRKIHGPQEAGNGPNIDWREEIHRGILRGLRNISETP